MQPTTTDDEKRLSPWFVALIVAVVLLFSIFATGVKAESERIGCSDYNGTACSMSSTPPVEATEQKGDATYPLFVIALILFGIVCAMLMSNPRKRR